VTGVAVILALGAAVLAQEASEARTVRVEGEDDARLAALTDAVRAELTAAGFAVMLPLDQAEPAGVVRLRMADDHCAVVTATAIDAGKVFQSLVGCEGTPGTDPRAGDRVALQLAEWMEAATWLPPPPADPSPPPAVRQAVDLSEPRPPRPARVSFFSLDTLEVATAAMRTPALGTRFGAEVAVSTHGRSPIVAGAAPFARLSLAYDWLGTAVSDAAGESIDARYGTLAIAGGLSRRLTRHWSAEVNVHLGGTLVWITANVLDRGAGALHRVSRSAQEITPGAAIAIVRDLSTRSSLALEARATWLSPGLIVQTPHATVGGSFWPAITGALALRMKP
jgi:hypothetical protein